VGEAVDVVVHDGDGGFAHDVGEFEAFADLGVVDGIGDDDDVRRCSGVRACSRWV
jgi:hypothetical protein